MPPSSIVMLLFYVGVLFGLLMLLDHYMKYELIGFRNEWVTKDSGPCRDWVNKQKSEYKFTQCLCHQEDTMVKAFDITISGHRCFVHTGRCMPSDDHW